MFTRSKLALSAAFVLLLALALAACQPQVVEVEVTRVVTETEVVEVEGEMVEVEVTVEVEKEVVVEQEVEVVVTATPVPAAQGGDLVNSSFADISTLNPIIGADTASSQNYTLMFDAIADIDAFSGAVIPEMAESWETSDDGLQVTITLRDDVFWSDGTQVTANDVAFTFDAIQVDDISSPRRSDYASVESWEVLDDQTIQMNLSAVDCAIPSTVFVQGILPAHVYDGDPMNIVDSPENSAPSVVSGPFTFVEHLPDERVTLAANPDYYGGAPNVDTYTYRVYADQSAEVAGLLAGEIDYTGVGPQFVSVIEGAIAGGDNLNIKKYFANGYTFIGYNLANPENPQNGWDDLDGDGQFTEGEPPLEQDPHPVLSDNEVRRALAYSIDYTGIINKVAFWPRWPDFGQHCAVG